MSQRVDALHYCQLRPFKPSRLAPPLPPPSPPPPPRSYHPSSPFPLSWLCRLLHHRHVALQPRESTSTTMMSPATALVRSTTGVQANLECRLQPRQLDNDTPMVYRSFLIYFPKLRRSVLLCLAIFPSPRGRGWMEIFVAKQFFIVDDHIFCTLLLRKRNRNYRFNKRMKRWS